MLSARQIIKTRIGSQEYESIRERAKKGEPDAMREFVLLCSWKGLTADKRLTPRQRRATLSSLMRPGVLEVHLGRQA